MGKKLRCLLVVLIVSFAVVYPVSAAEVSSDVVTIIEAIYKADRDEFKVKALSSEYPNAVLTVVGWGVMEVKRDKYELKIRPLSPIQPPSSVTVTSSLGGSATSPVEGAPAPTLPDQASNPNPSDGASSVSVSAILSWTAGSGADSHDVYFGTNPNPGAGEFQGNQTGNTFDPGPLALDTTYYWRIDEVNAYGTTTGAVWSFTTEAAPPPTVEPQPEGTFGEQYEDLIPPDATISEYDSTRFSLITGLVRDIGDLPIADVSITILDHPEYGTASTLERYSHRRSRSYDSGRPGCYHAHLRRQSGYSSHAREH
jgi:hypothetical protein